MLMCMFLVHVAHETAGAARIRHSLRPLNWRGREVSGKISGKSCRENANARPAVIARSACDEAIHLSAVPRDGLLRGACHRARIRATRWLAMTAIGRANGIAACG